jgi:hypothetical protein
MVQEYAVRGLADSEASHPFARKKAKGWGTEMVQE